MFTDTTVTSYVTDFDMRKEALNQAMRHTKDGSTTDQVIAAADAFYGFLKGADK